MTIWAIQLDLSNSIVADLRIRLGLHPIVYVAKAEVPKWRTRPETRKIYEVKLTVEQVAGLAQGSYSLPKEWTP